MNQAYIVVVICFKGLGLLILILFMSFIEYNGEPDYINSNKRLLSVTIWRNIVRKCNLINWLYSPYVLLNILLVVNENEIDLWTTSQLKITYYLLFSNSKLYLNKIEIEFHGWKECRKLFFRHFNLLACMICSIYWNTKLSKLHESFFCSYLNICFYQI